MFTRRQPGMVRQCVSDAPLDWWPWRSSTVPYLSAKSDEPLPVPHRLAMAYLAVPLAVWLIGYFHWWMGVPLALLVGVSLWTCMTGPWRFRPPTIVWPILALSVLYIALSPVSFGALGNTDQPKHRGILTDLVESTWPVKTVVVDASGVSINPYVRYYLGYYMVPALLAKPFGLSGLHFTLPVWTLIGWVLGGVVLCHGLRNTHALILMFGLGAFAYFNFGQVVHFLSTVFATLGVNDFGNTLGVEASGVAYRSLTWGNDFSLVFRFAPQHFLAVLVGTSLVLRLHDRKEFHRATGVVLLCVAWWSPYVAVGLGILVAGMMVSLGPCNFLSWQNLLAAPLLALPLVAFLLSEGPVSAEARWIWELLPVRTSILLLGVYYLTGFVPWAVAINMLCEQTRRASLFWASCVGFLLCPIFQIESHFLDGNELQRNTTLVFVLAFWFWLGQALPRYFYDAVETLSVRKGILVLVVLLMLLPGMCSRAKQDTWAMADSGIRRYDDSPVPIGRVEEGKMYLVEKWPPMLEALLKD